MLARFSVVICMYQGISSPRSGRAAARPGCRLLPKTALSTVGALGQVEATRDALAVRGGRRVSQTTGRASRPLLPFASLHCMGALPPSAPLARPRLREPHCVGERGENLPGRVLHTRELVEVAEAKRLHHGFLFGFSAFSSMSALREPLPLA